MIIEVIRMTKKTSRKVVGAPRKYTPKTLRTAVNRYFASISRERELWEKIPDGIDENGKERFKTVRVLNAMGEPATVIEYFEKPSISRLSIYLHIHRDTWNEYSHLEEYKDICMAAKEEIEAYLWGKLGGGKGDNGIMFELTNNHGAKNKLEVEAGERARKVIENIPRTMDEKLRFLSEHGYSIPGAGDDDDAED